MERTNLALQRHELANGVCKESAMQQKAWGYRLNLFSRELVFFVTITEEGKGAECCFFNAEDAINFYNGL